MLRCWVSSDLDDLQKLHEETGWVPGRENVRPTPVVRAQKEMMMTNMGAMWASQADWVCQQVFGSKATRRPDGLKVAERPAAGSVSHPAIYADSKTSTENSCCSTTGGSYTDSGTLSRQHCSDGVSCKIGR